MKLESSAGPMPKMPENQDGDVCIANISTAGRRQRLTFGIVQFMLAIIILVVLIALDVDRFWRLPLFFLFWAAAVGFFQWRDKTCVALSRAGSREVMGQVEKIEDEGELAQVQRQARKLVVKALLVGILLTLLALAYPS